MKQINTKSLLFLLLILSLTSCSRHFKSNSVYEKQIIQYQLNSDPNNDPCYINRVAAQNDIKQLQYLINKAKINHTLDNKLRCTGNATGTPLGFAVANNAYQAVELLLKNGADPTNMGEETDPPIMIAVLQKQTKLVSLLLDYDADKHLDYTFEASRIKAAGAEMIQLFQQKRRKKFKLNTL